MSLDFTQVAPARLARRSSSASFLGIHIHAEDAALVAHQRGEVERLAAGTGTGVDDALAGLGIDERGDELRAGVLDFHPAVGAQRFGQGFAGSKHQGVGQSGDFGGGDVDAWRATRWPGRGWS